MDSTKLLLNILFITYNVVQSNPTNLKKVPKTILILADGIRYDYVNEANLTGFSRIAKNGVRAKYVQPIFPANSYPNWYTIVTGKSTLQYF
jgi:predicted AlkP superfamily pyrophosphatase or phosphodiesterase